jgi:tagatose 6-phosphate kinase
MRCLTITLNPTVDTTYWLDDLVVGGTNRVRRMRQVAAGKGVNVARVMRCLGRDVVATGFLGGDNGRFIDGALRAEDVVTRFEWLEQGSSRNCHTMVDARTTSSTEVLEGGPGLTERDRRRFLHRLETLLPGVEAVVIAGSVPEGSTLDFLQEIVRLVRSHAHRLFVDASGPALRDLLACRPDLIKPNAHEMEMLMGWRAPLTDQVAFARDELIGTLMPDDGQVLLTLGKDGALLISRDHVLRARNPEIDAVNTVGCGDALMAGFVDSWLEGQGDVNALRNAVACGSAAALREVAGEIDVDDRDRLLGQVELSMVDRAGATVPLASAGRTPIPFPESVQYPLRKITSR